MKKVSPAKFKKSLENKKEKFERLPLKRFYIFSFVISLVTVVIAFVSNFFLPPEIPLFYGFPQSQQQLSSSIFLFIPSTLSIVITVLNAYLSIFISNNYLKKVLAFSSLIISFLSSVTTLKIISLVGNI